MTILLLKATNSCTKLVTTPTSGFRHCLPDIIIFFFFFYFVAFVFLFFLLLHCDISFVCGIFFFRLSPLHLHNPVVNIQWQKSHSFSALGGDAKDPELILTI